MIPHARDAGRQNKIGELQSASISMFTTLDISTCKGEFYTWLHHVHAIDLQ